MSVVALLALGRFLFTAPEAAIDFPHYYTAAGAYLLGQSPYIPGHELDYLYPPAFLALMLPFASLPLGLALVLWDGMQVILVGLTLTIALRHRLQARQLATLLAFLPLWYPAFMALRFGQVAGILLMGWLMFGHELRVGRELRAGLWLSLLAIKPPLLLVPLCLLLYLHRGRALVGILIGSAIWLVSSVAMVGPKGLLDYARTLLAAVSAQSADAVYRTSTYSLGSIANLFPSHSWLVLLVLDALTVSLVLRITRGRSVEDSVAIATPAMLLVSPHVLVYDLLPLVATLPLLLRSGRGFVAACLAVAVTAIPLAHAVLAMPQIVSLFMLGLVLIFSRTRFLHHLQEQASRGRHTPHSTINPIASDAECPTT